MATSRVCDEFRALFADAHHQPKHHAFEQLLVVSCIDKRLVCAVFERLAAHGAYIFRNGGGRITDDVMRSAAPAIRFAGVTDIIILMHTDCLFEKLTDAEIRTGLTKNLGPCTAEFHHGAIYKETCAYSGKDNRDKHENAAYLAFATFTDLPKAVTDAVWRLRNSPLISHHVNIFGMYYDVKHDKIVHVAESLAP